MDFIQKNINDIHLIIKNKLIYFNGVLIKRMRKLTCDDVLSALCDKIYSGNSYDTVNCSAKIERGCDVTKAAIIKKRTLLTAICIQTICDEILLYIYKNPTPRIFAVDGVNVILDKNLAKFDFKLSDNKFYAKGLISCIYDVMNNITVNYNLVKHSDERRAFLDQLKYVRKGDIVIFDRGYYSNELIKILTDKGIHYIFRMKKDSKMVKELNKTDLKSLKQDIIIKNNTIPVRVVKYEIEPLKTNVRAPKNNMYYVLTSLMNHDILMLKNLYHSRWSIETSFRFAKMSLTLNDIVSKTEENVMQDIVVHNLISIISGYILSLLNSVKKNKNVNINQKNLLIQICEKILPTIIHEKVNSDTLKTIMKVIKCISEIVYSAEPDRHFPRRKVRPLGKWGIAGNIFAYK
jgi:hypothetical protein